MKTRLRFACVVHTEPFVIYTAPPVCVYRPTRREYGGWWDCVHMLFWRAESTAESTADRWVQRVSRGTPEVLQSSSNRRGVYTELYFKTYLLPVKRQLMNEDDSDVIFPLVASWAHRAKRSPITSSRPRREEKPRRMLPLPINPRRKVTSGELDAREAIAWESGVERSGTERTREEERASEGEKRARDEEERAREGEERAREGEERTKDEEE